MSRILSALTVTFLLCLATGTVVRAQPSVALGEILLGGSGPDTLTAIVFTPVDGGYIAGGYSSSDASGSKKEDSKGGLDYWVIKLNDKYDIEWQRTIGGSGDDRLESIIPLKGGDAGYVLAGTSSSPVSGDKTAASKGGSDFWILQIDSKGDNIEWQKTIGGDRNDRLTVIKEDLASGGLIAGGYSYSGVSGDKTGVRKGGSPALDVPDFWIVKLQDDGTFEWDATIGGVSGGSYLQDIAFWKDSYILAGHSGAGSGADKSEDPRGGAGDEDYWVVNYHAKDGKQWDFTYGGDQAEHLAKITSDEANGGFILSGTSASDKSGDRMTASRGGRDYWIVKLSEEGKMEAEYVFGSGEDDILTDLRAINGGADGFLAGGYSSGGADGDKTEAARSKGQTDYWVVRLASDFEKEWDLTWGGTDGDDRLAAIELTPNADWVAAGTSGSQNGGDKTMKPEGGDDYWIAVFPGTCTPKRIEVAASFCKGSSYRLPDGTSTGTAGTYTSMVPGSSGCVDTVITELAELPSYTIERNDTFCKGGAYVLPNGMKIYESGVYTASFKTAAGCDSVFVITLHADEPDTTELNASVCSGGDYVLPDGRIVNRPGTYLSLLRKESGNCDSAVRVHVNITDFDLEVRESDGTFTASMTGADGYQWLNCVTLQPVPGAQGTSFKPDTSGWYALVIRKNQCLDTTACMGIVVPLLLPETAAGEARVRIYPNPARDVLYVESVKDIETEIRSADGKVVVRHTGSGMIDLRGVVPGLYLVRISDSTGETIGVQKLLISR